MASSSHFHFITNYFHFYWLMQSCVVWLHYLLWVQCAVSLLSSHRFKVHSWTGGRCKLLVLTERLPLRSLSLSPCCVLLAPGSVVCRPQGPAFVSSHPLCCCPEPVLSPAIGLASLRGVELKAQVNRWAAVSQEWNFSPIGLRDFRLGGL